MDGAGRTEPAGHAPRWTTRGQPTALAAVARMVAGVAPHAVLLVGPPAVGKTTLAEDLAAGLLCGASDPGARPCRTCRSCRLLAAGNHLDLHRLVPTGPGGQVVVGDPRDAKAPRGVRDLLHEMALRPIEGQRRVAIVEAASQMNEEAQNAILKTLEEPPPGVTIVLCADEEDALLPTVRSRCARVRLGPTGPREIEGLLGDRGLADAPTAARIARLAEGRPGAAVAFARAPEAIVIRDEIARTLVDLLATGPARRLAAARDLAARAGELADALAGPTPAPEAPAQRGRRGAPRASPAPGRAGAEAEPSEDGEADFAIATRRAPAAERRRAARQLVAIMRVVARDLAVAAAGGRAELRDPDLLEALDAAALVVPAGAAAAFLARLDQVAELLDGNAGPELAVDVLILAWPLAGLAAA